MLLDPATLIFMSVLMAIAMSIVLFSSYYSYPPEIRGLNYWASSLLMLVAGAGLFASNRLGVPDLVVLLTANSAFVCGVGLTLIGTQKFYGLKPSWWLFSLIWLLCLAGITYWHVWESSFSARVAVFSYLVAVYYFYLTIIVWRHGEPHFSTRFLYVLLGIQSVVVFTRGTLAMLFGSELANIMVSGPFQSLYLALGQFMILLLAVSFNTVSTRRLQVLLERRSTLDPLTQVLNRRGFADVYAKELGLMRRQFTVMTVLSIDLDYFKKINDTHGHIVGDRVLVEVAQLIGKALRVSDHIARFGGEEFVVLLPETGLDRALQIAERILKAVRASGAHGLPPYTVSIGVACQSSSEENLDGLLRRADQALYRAKDGGRDRIEIAAPVVSSSMAPAPIATPAAAASFSSKVS